MKIYQASYGKPGNVNWELFQASPDLPGEMRSYFERVGSRCTPQMMDREAIEDESRQSKEFFLYEISSFQGIICLTCAKYGLNDFDAGGRRKMTAKGYLGYVQDGVLNDPNTFLSIADDRIDVMARVQEPISRTEGYTLAGAMDQAGLSWQDLISLMSCIYLIITGMSNRPFVIVSKQVSNIMKPVIYCIYRMLPYSLRHLLSFSNANTLGNALLKGVVFSDHAYMNWDSFNLDTKNLSMNLSLIQQKKEDFPFLYRAMDLSSEQFSIYCQRLQEIVYQLTHKVAAEYRTTVFADIVLSNPITETQKTNEELLRFIFQLLVRAPMQSQFADDYLVAWLQEYAKRNVPYNDALMQRLGKRVDLSNNKTLREIYCQLQISGLLQKGEKDALSFLYEQKKKGKDIFSQWIDRLLEHSQGKDVVCSYYVTQISMCSSLKELEVLCLEYRSKVNDNQLEDAAVKKLYKLISAELLRTPVQKNHCEAVFHQLEDSLNRLFPFFNRGYSQIIASLTKQYWDHFRFSDFSFSPVQMENYRFMEDWNHPTCQQLLPLLEMEQIIRNNGARENVIQEIDQKIQQFCTGKVWFSLSDADRIHVTQEIQEYVLEQLRPYQNGHFYFWYHLASLDDGATGKKPLVKMYQWNLPVLQDETCFDQAICAPEVQELLPQIYADAAGDQGSVGYLSLLDNHSNEYRLISTRLKTLKKYLKQKEKSGKQKKNDGYGTNQYYSDFQSTGGPYSMNQPFYSESTVPPTIENAPYTGYKSANLSHQSIESDFNSSPYQQNCGNNDPNGYYGSTTFAPQPQKQSVYPNTGKMERKVPTLNLKKEKPILEHAKETKGIVSKLFGKKSNKKDK